MKRYSRKKRIPLYIKVLFFITFVIFLGWSIFLVREKLLINANQMGTNLAKSYANEEENRINMYSLLLNMMSYSVQGSVSHDISPDLIQEQMANYSKQLENMLGATIIEPYAVIDGEIIAADPWEGDADYSYVSSAWYQKALNAQGKVIYTNAYEDAVTGKKVITLAKRMNENNDVLAFDILLENFHTHQNKVVIPESSSFYLFDSADDLMYFTSDMVAESSEAQNYLNKLASNIRAGKLDSHDDTIRGLDGRNRVVYYYELSNGWLSVITIPIDVILQDGWDTTILVLSAICAVLVIIAAFIMIRGYFSDRSMKQIYETLQILGDSYYAIYRVNFRAETYTSIKSSDDVKELLGDSGSYRHLLDVVKNVVDESTHEKFEESLSAENIRKLIAEGIYDFGGDYQRDFGGNYKWVNIQVLYNKGLHIDEVILAFREIDADKRRELQQHVLLQNALEAAKKTVQQKTMFFSNASHDMRTPLNAIIGLSKLAQRPEVSSETIDEYIKKIQNSGEQLLTLVNDILDVSRLEHGRGNSLNYISMNICKCVRENVDLFREQAASENKVLTDEYEVHFPHVYCDPSRLSQILNNLISNAMKYSHEGAKIHVSLKELNHQPGHSKYQITVQDTGIGMAKEYLANIFEPFSREATFTANKVTGTGLGMPIVKTLIQQMSGEITVSSELGKGSTFIVTLPLQNLEEEEELETAETEHPADDFTLEGKTLLLAEDNEINMEVATECLDMLGAHVIQAWNGQEAVSLFQASDENQIDAILMDMQMPVMDGCKAAETIRSLRRPDAKTVPIIAVTANVFAEDIARTTQAGMNAHIAKPIDFKQLQSVLKDCLDEERHSAV